MVAKGLKLHSKKLSQFSKDNDWMSKLREVLKSTSLYKKQLKSRDQLVIGCFILIWNEIILMTTCSTVSLKTNELLSSLSVVPLNSFHTNFNCSYSILSTLMNYLNRLVTCIIKLLCLLLSHFYPSTNILSSSFSLRGSNNFLGDSIICIEL